MSRFIERNCETCNGVFTTDRKYLKRGGGRFCSSSCAAIYGNSLKPEAESVSRLNEIAREVYIKRNGLPSCSHCGTVPADVHHLNENKKDNSKENLLALCRSCHVAYHNHVAPKRKKAA